MKRTTRTAVILAVWTASIVSTYAVTIWLTAGPSHPRAPSGNLGVEVTASLNGTWSRYSGIGMALLCYYDVAVTVSHNVNATLNVTAEVLVYRNFTYNSVNYPTKNATFVFHDVSPGVSYTNTQNVSAYFPEPAAPLACPEPVTTVTSFDVTYERR